MRKPLGRITGLLLAVVITVIAMLAGFAYAATQDESMETALIAVKSIIDVDDEVFTDFNFRSGYSNWETREGLIWYFEWSDGKSAHIYASATADGVLLEYNIYRSDGRSYGFAEISKDAAAAEANRFIEKANPDTYVYYKAPVEVNVNLHSSDYYLAYSAEVNGHAFEAASIRIGVNKFTGLVSSYYSRNVDPGRFRFESASGTISQDAAVAAYAEKIGLALEYMSWFDYESGSLTVFPAYLFNARPDLYIGARTGEIVNYVYDLGEAGAGAPEPRPSAVNESEASMDAGGSRASLTPAERAAIEQVAGFLTSEQALDKLLEAAELTDVDLSSFENRFIGLNRDYIDKDRYYYDINLSRYGDWVMSDSEIVGIYGRVDAETGRVYSFSFYYNGVPQGDSVFTEAQATSAVDAFLKRIAPGEFAKSKLESSPSLMGERYGRGYEDYYYGYARYENDTIFRDNGINVAFNRNTGKITNYSLRWYDNAVFPSVANVLTQQRALDAYVGGTGSRIVYITTGDSNAGLVYDFLKDRFIDPFTGNALDYSGKPWTDATQTPAYGDVTGHWAERYVNKLLDNGIFMWGGRFEPDKVMTELEFLQYIMLLEGYSLARADVASYYTNLGVDVEASADKLLTRQEAARIVAEFLGYKKLAGQSNWFVYPFTDSVDETYKGHITICFMLGIVGGDNGRFDPLVNITRAHAAVLLHNLIIARS